MAAIPRSFSILGIGAGGTPSFSTIAATGNVASSSTTTGTVVVTGGVGISGAAYLGSLVLPGSANVQRGYNNFSTAGDTPAATTRTYLTGSAITITAGQIIVGTVFRWRFAMTKTAAGSAASTIDIAFGVTGTTTDAAQVSFTKPAGTAAADEGWVEVQAIVKTNGASGVVVGTFRMIHNLAATGHMVIPCAVVTTTSSTFNTLLPTNIGLCITTGASDAITVSQCSAEAVNL